MKEIINMLIYGGLALYILGGIGIGLGLWTLIYLIINR
mgnify:CR=1 FL=1